MTKVKQCILAIYLFTTTAYVYAVEDIIKIVQNIYGFLVGGFGQTVAVVAIVILGYMTLSGRMDFRRALFITIGIALIFLADDVITMLGFTAPAPPTTKSS